MRAWQLLALTLAALGLAGCTTAQGPTATCFNLIAGEPCSFTPVPGDARPEPGPAYGRRRIP